MASRSFPEAAPRRTEKLERDVGWGVWVSQAWRAMGAEAGEGGRVGAAARSLERPRTVGVGGGAGREPRRWRWAQTPCTGCEAGWGQSLSPSPLSETCRILGCSLFFWFQSGGPSSFRMGPPTLVQSPEV